MNVKCQNLNVVNSILLFLFFECSVIKDVKNLFFCMLLCGAIARL